MFTTQYLGALALYSGLSAALKFDGPIATPIVRDILAADGWSPKPTAAPASLPELFRRQLDPAFCGYLEGDPEFPMSCDAGSSCRFAESLGWWGCCTGTAVSDCEVATRCIESASISSCLGNAECSQDPFVTGCTEATAASCVRLNTLILESTYSHFACASQETTWEVVFTTTANATSGRPTSTEAGTETESETGRPSVSSIPRPSVSSISRPSVSSIPRPTVDSISRPEVDPVTRPNASSRTTGGNSQPTVATNAGASSSSSTAAAAQNTAEAMIAAAGGVLGFMAMFV
ncbi:hypothetical protein BU24DRAFT_453692 [Aaosphaeria arxii CBS 175.79]|uniref:Extracellular membrane protein CFEM domain-containing protein n=1 Tax=Aaosphaeria arxii CBS 175.79 TaxID=1450172 RepID=A0A6A5XH44_9PLEO|nr:uncharacterized protein BU24DRAFT_453692 [Aaosphaeria arxii CBS 175.79]KAF2012263.1 hypothetical protein BU24DRAFT_453692 [Aaosphaeria arxii CBS 175.79]